jgi:hypothetical protein
MFKVTFDTNSFDKAARPHVYTKDPDHTHFARVNGAIKDGRVTGFICETGVTLEGIKVDDRAKVFGSTTLATNMSAEENSSIIRVNMKMEQPLRSELRPKQVERFAAALDLGMRLLGAPRTGIPHVEMPNCNPYAKETEAELSSRLERYFQIAEAIEQRGLGSVRAGQLAQRLASRAGATVPWFKVLGAVQDIHETREVARAIAEWADADSIAAHYGYGNDMFCTRDEARHGHPSILDSDNRKWLSETFGIRFVDLRELAALL